jgi:hypothetical protein
MGFFELGSPKLFAQASFESPPSKMLPFLKMKFSWSPVAQTCDPSYSGARDEEDFGWKPLLARV